MEPCSEPAPHQLSHSSQLPWGSLLVPGASALLWSGFRGAGKALSSVPHAPSAPPAPPGCSPWCGAAAGSSPVWGQRLWRWHWSWGQLCVLPACGAAWPRGLGKLGIAPLDPAAPLGKALVVLNPTVDDLRWAQSTLGSPQACDSPWSVPQVGQLLRNLTDLFPPCEKGSLQGFECRGGVEGQLCQAGAAGVTQGRAEWGRSGFASPWVLS